MGKAGWVELRSNSQETAKRSPGPHPAHSLARGRGPDAPLRSAFGPSIYGFLRPVTGNRYTHPLSDVRCLRSAVPRSELLLRRVSVPGKGGTKESEQGAPKAKKESA